MKHTDDAEFDREFLSLNEVADILHADIADIHLLISSGELPAIKLGATGKWRVEVSVLNAFIEHEYEEARRAAAWNGSPTASAHNVFEL